MGRCHPPPPSASAPPPPMLIACTRMVGCHCRAVCGCVQEHLFSDTPYDAEDKEADDIYDSVEDFMDSRRKRQREEALREVGDGGSTEWGDAVRHRADARMPVTRGAPCGRTAGYCVGEGSCVPVWSEGAPACLLVMMCVSVCACACVFVRALQELKKIRAERPRISDQFADLKAKLATVRLARHMMPGCAHPRWRSCTRALV